jgi:hypothetical protein
MMHLNFGGGVIQANHLIVKNLLHDDYPRCANIYTDCDTDLMKLLSPEQLERFIPYQQSLYQNDGDFRPIISFQ